MSKHRFISEALRTETSVLSVEFFPPKTEEGKDKFLDNANQIRSAFQPDFVSITYGAGGSTRERTVEYAKLLKNDIGFEVMPHLTCVGHSRDEIREILQRFSDEGFNNIMTLRGDPPRGETNFKPHPDGLRYASELVTFIRETFPDFCLGVAGYPEMHTEATSPDEDIKNLKAKVDRGASFITTQVFFDNADYYRFVERCRSIGITVPIVPGILSIHALAPIKRFCAMCGSSIPQELEDKLLAAGEEGSAAEAVGIDWAFAQLEDLYKNGAPGFHLYCLNRARPAVEIARRIKETGIFPRRRKEEAVSSAKE
ncbi:MAG: methylenetetrahydrofolate reductase [NAD(P)H] [Opitutales bacterium]